MRRIVQQRSLSHHTKMDFFSSFLGPSCVIQIRVKNGDPDRLLKVLNHEEIPQFLTRNESVSGECTISPKNGRSIDLAGIKIEFIGQIETLFGNNNPFEFTSLVKELEHSSTLDRVKTYSFLFPAEQLETSYESYNGVGVNVKYFLRVTMTPRNALSLNVVKEHPLWFVQLTPPPSVNPPSKTEVGVTGFLHIEVTFAKEKYFLNEVIVGKIFFAKVKLKIRSMEIVLIKKEKIGSGLISDENSKLETVQVGKVEIMDGFPARGEVVPIRIFLAQFADHLSPTMPNINNQFSVDYYLSVVLIDETGRRYFREHEIGLYRRSL